jgi:NAD-dependent dihydropyrimidine dehydrogenase PreA subunit
MSRFIWGPTIDAGACTSCRTCHDFCHQGVYGLEGDTVVVADKAACVPGCSHCATLCEQGAISFPSIEDLRRARATGEL